MAGINTLNKPYPDFDTNVSILRIAAGEGHDNNCSAPNDLAYTIYRFFIEGLSRIDTIWISHRLFDHHAMESHRYLHHGRIVDTFGFELVASMFCTQIFRVVTTNVPERYNKERDYQWMIGFFNNDAVVYAKDICI